MATREIPRREWTEFFNQFSREYLGRIATLEVVGPDMGDQPAAEAQPFRGISADEKDNENRIAILVGTGITHTVMSPSEVWVEEGDAGHVSLEIRGTDGGTWLLTFVAEDLLQA
ncbi:MAG TPA: DUF5335 family protein [Chloroflexota bacterium]|nr:DUF5335 family protein [Chloroflexota bacterium]